MKSPNDLEIFISIIVSVFLIINTYFYFRCRKEYYITRAKCEFNNRFITGIDKNAIDTVIYGLLGCLAVFYPITYCALTATLIYTFFRLRYIKKALEV